MDCMEEKKCLHCGKILGGRLDKKFCDHYCRNSYNNNTARDSEKRINEINRILRRNRTILRQINPEGRTTIRKEYLQLQGFNFNYLTHHYVTKTNNVYNFCYEYGYLVSEDDDKIVIVNWQGYMDIQMTE
jgi:hypothetical protein